MTVAARVGLVLVLLGLAGCAADDPEQAPATPDGTSAGTASTSLLVTVDRGDGTGAEHTLTCDPPGGTHPNPQAACDLLGAAPGLDPNPLEPVPADVACTEIYGGPQTAVVSGTLAGEAVSVEFSRVDGCEIARWDAALALLAEPGGAGP